MQFVGRHSKVRAQTGQTDTQTCLNVLPRHISMWTW